MCIFQKFNKYILSIVLVLAMMVCALAGCSQIDDESASISEDKKLVIYTAHKEKIYKPIIKEFERRTGIWVEVRTGETKAILDEISKEKNEVSADIMFGGGVDSLMMYEDCFEPYITTQEKHLDQTYASEGHYYTVFSKLPVVFIYNTKLLMPSGAPYSWKHLLDAGFTNDIAFADPEKSGSSFTALSFMVQHLSKEELEQEEIVRDFCRNLQGSISSGSEQVFTDVANGDKAVGITLEETALKNMTEDVDVQIVYPKDGTCALPDGCAMLKGAKHRENAEKFMEFIVCDDVQHLLEDQLFRRSVRTDFESSEIPSEIEYDLKYIEQNKDKIMELWRKYK